MTDLMERLPTMRSLWWTVLIIGSGLLVAALYWQYALGENPCQVCIQARLWVVAIALTGALMLVLPGNTGIQFWGLMLLLISSVGLGERSHYLYQIENFRGDGSCQFTLGMPDWFAVDRWLPTLFEVRAICSYTPDILLGISMAEALMLIAAGLCLLTFISAFRLLFGGDSVRSVATYDE